MRINPVLGSLGTLLDDGRNAFPKHITGPDSYRSPPVMPVRPVTFEQVLNRYATL